MNLLLLLVLCALLICRDLGVGLQALTGRLHLLEQLLAMCDFYRKRRDRCTLPNVSAVSAFFINSAKWLSTTVTVVESQFIAHDGATTTTEVADGTSVMRAAMNNRIGGIVAECGGSMMCATCHVYLRAPWAARLAPIDATEEAMLTMTVAERRPGSRLCCQIIVGAALDGLTVEVPDKQV